MICGAGQMKPSLSGEHISVWSENKLITAIGGEPKAPHRLWAGGGVFMHTHAPHRDWREDRLMSTLLLPGLTSVRVLKFSVTLGLP